MIKTINRLAVAKVSINDVLQYITKCPLVSCFPYNTAKYLFILLELKRNFGVIRDISCSLIHS